MALRNFGQKWNGFNIFRAEGKIIVMREHIHYQIASYFDGFLRKWTMLKMLPKASLAQYEISQEFLTYSGLSILKINV